MADAGRLARLKGSAARYRSHAMWAIGAVAAFAVLGFLVLPPVVRHFGARALADTLGREVAIESVRINPFALSMTVRGVGVAEADGQPGALSLGELYANLEAMSLFRGGPVLRELRLDAPSVRFARLESGRNNWSDVVERLAARPTPEDEGEARFSLNNIRITGGHVLFEDQPKGLRHELSEINIGLPFLSNLPAQVELFVEPDVAALLNGRPLHVGGQTRPFAPDRETALDITLDGFDFTPYVAYLPFEAAFRVPEGRLTTRLQLAFSQPAEAAPKLVVRGDVELADFRLQDADGAPMLRVPSLALKLADVEPLAGKWHFEQLELAGPEADVVRLADGAINFARLAPAKRPAAGPRDSRAPAGARPASGIVRTAEGGEPPAEAAPPAEAKPDAGDRTAAGAGREREAPSFRLDHAKITGGIVRFEDRAAGAPFRTELKSLALEAKNLATAPDAVAEVALDFTTDAGETSSHRDRVRLAPFELDGRVVATNLLATRYAPYYAAALPGGEIRGGRVDATVRYTIKSAEGEPRVDALAESLVLREFELALKRRDAPLVKLARLAVENVAVTPAERTVKIAAVETKGGALSVVKLRDGSLDALALVGEPRGGKAAEPAPRSPPGADAKPWTVTLDRLTLQDWAVRFEDRTQASPIVVQAEGLNVAAEGVGNVKDAVMKIRLDSRVNKRGRAQVEGTLRLAPLGGELKVDLRGVELLAAQPYVAEQLNVGISRGNVTTRGTLALDTARDGALKLRFRGDLAVADFSSVDRNHSTDFLRWKNLRLAGIDLRTAPLAVSVGEVALTDFYTRLILDEDGTLNLREIRQRPDEGEAKPEPKTTGRTTTVELPPPPAEPPPPISIGKILFEQGNVAFSDRFIRPNYDANLTGVKGEITGLSSDPSTLARLDLHGSIDNSAPVTVSGEFNPFRQDRYLNIAASVKDFELTGVSAYSGKYVGYGIQKGKLSAELSYRIEDRKLSATNRLFLDQLTFGDRVDDPEAPNLPVQLAVSLLQNRNGEIDLNLPIGGSLDDPQFSIGSLVVKAILNLIGKALTAPFALLGAMFGGGGEELSELEFPPGRSDLDGPAGERVAKLAKALGDRPRLRVEITGGADPATDVEGLKKVYLMRTVKAAKLKGEVPRGEVAPLLDEVVVGADEYPKWLERVYRDADFKRPRNAIGLLKDLPPAEMESLLLANIAVDDEALRDLAQERAQAVKTRLLDAGEIGAERIFLSAPKVEAGGRRALFALK